MIVIHLKITALIFYEHENETQRYRGNMNKWNWGGRIGIEDQKSWKAQSPLNSIASPLSFLVIYANVC